MTRGGSDGAEECSQMMAEKITAFTDANWLVRLHWPMGLAALSALAPIKERVRASFARLLSE